MSSYLGFIASAHCQPSENTDTARAWQTLRQETLQPSMFEKLTGQGLPQHAQQSNQLRQDAVKLLRGFGESHPTNDRLFSAADLLGKLYAHKKKISLTERALTGGFDSKTKTALKSVLGQFVFENQKYGSDVNEMKNAFEQIKNGENPSDIIKNYMNFSKSTISNSLFDEPVSGQKTTELAHLLGRGALDISSIASNPFSDDHDVDNPFHDNHAI